MHIEVAFIELKNQHYTHTEGAASRDEAPS